MVSFIVSNFKIGASAGKSAGSNTAIHKRQLMTIDEINRMPDHEQLIILAGKRPVRLGKARYFEIPDFAGKFDKNPFYRGDN